MFVLDYSWTNCFLGPLYKFGIFNFNYYWLEYEQIDSLALWIFKLGIYNFNYYYIEYNQIDSLCLNSVYIISTTKYCVLCKGSITKPVILPKTPEPLGSKINISCQLTYGIPPNQISPIIDPKQLPKLEMFVGSRNILVKTYDRGTTDFLTKYAVWNVRLIWDCWHFTETVLFKRKNVYVTTYDILFNFSVWFVEYFALQLWKPREFSLHDIHYCYRINLNSFL